MKYISKNPKSQIQKENENTKISKESTNQETPKINIEPYIEYEDYEKNLQVTIKPAKLELELEPPKTKDDPKKRKQKPKNANMNNEKLSKITTTFKPTNMQEKTNNENFLQKPMPSLDKRQVSGQRN